TRINCLHENPSAHHAMGAGYHAATGPHSRKNTIASHAGDGTRTRRCLRTSDFESLAFTSFATPAALPSPGGVRQSSSSLTGIECQPTARPLLLAFGRRVRPLHTRQTGQSRESPCGGARRGERPSPII